MLSDVATIIIDHKMHCKYPQLFHKILTGQEQK